jgi:hypothetical protein
MYMPHAYTPLYLLGYLTTCLCTHPTYIVPTVSVVDTTHGLYGQLLALPSRPLFSWADAGQHLRLGQCSFAGQKKRSLSNPYIYVNFFRSRSRLRWPVQYPSRILTLFNALTNNNSIDISELRMAPPFWVIWERRAAGTKAFCSHVTLISGRYCAGDVMCSKTKKRDRWNRYRRDHSGIMSIKYYIGAGE